MYDARYDRRHFPPGGGIGPVVGVRTVDLAAADFEDPRGFVWHCTADGTYTYRAIDSSADTTVTLTAGEYPQVASVPVLCEAVRMGAGLGIIAAGL